MEPYVGDKHKDKGKFRIIHEKGAHLTDSMKLEAKNANRSRKKAKRRELKEEIKKALDAKEPED